MINSPLTWVGGKRNILGNILPYIGNPNTLVEPFVGSATIALNVKAGYYRINDLNQDLINVYHSIINNMDDMISVSEPHFQDMSKEKYYKVRDRFNSLPFNVERAGLFLVLNKFGFNGLCRYNSKGIYNVPYNNTVCLRFPIDELKAFKQHFTYNPSVFHTGTFENEKLYENLTDGDVVYFDPPYMPSDDFDGNFTNYTKENFTIDQHRKIVTISNALRKKGVICLISNHFTSSTEKLYNDCDELVIIPKKRLLCADKSKRKEINEVMAVYGKVTKVGQLFND